MPATSIDAPEQEIRFAVVLYGGVSLAIYINGVAQELLRLVRSSILPKEQLTGSELIYRKISSLMNAGRKPGDPLPEHLDDLSPKARFVVDIISGTSAGGINGVALAKSLALKCPDMSALEKTWLEEAQIDDLFNGGLASCTSLLDSKRMYELIHSTLQKMNPAKTDTAGSSFADQIDLFVTATDLNGLYEPLVLADGVAQERVHKNVFQFSYVSQEYAQAYGLEPSNDFTADCDPMLAFAARCTSSFPVAFEPMQFDAIRKGLVSDERRAQFERFFSRYKAQGAGFAASQGKLPLGERLFADGGYLDNRPFSYAIDLIQYRASSIPVQRKLLFVDPFPEFKQDHPNETNINFMQNAELAMTTLPRYQTIRDDIERINDNNRRQDRLCTLLDDLNSFWQEELTVSEKLTSGKVDPLGRLNDTNPWQLNDSDLRKTPVSELVKTYGYSDSYISYHMLRKQVTTSDLSISLASTMGCKANSDEAHFILLLLRMWRLAHFVSTECEIVDKAFQLAKGVELDNAFLLDFDIEFERRRINDLISAIDNRRKIKALAVLFEGIPDDAISKLRSGLNKQLIALSTTKREALTAVESKIATLIEALKADFQAMMKERDRNNRYDAASRAYKTHKQDIDGLMEAIKEIYGGALESAREKTAELLSTQPRLLAHYQTFQWHDAVSLPFLDGTSSREHTKIEVYRVSPAESTLWPSSVKRPDKKLAGTAVAAFGGFLQESWRRNDIMWGRLDGAERIIAALLPDEKDAGIRESFIKAVHEDILFQCLTQEEGKLLFGWLADRLKRETAGAKTPEEIIRYAKMFFPESGEVIKRDKMANFIKCSYDLPSSPPPERVVDWTSRALRIFGRMISDLPETVAQRDAGITAVRKRLSLPFRWAALLLTQIVAFGVPERVGYNILPRWLLLIALAAFVLIVAGLLNFPGVADVGYLTILICLLIWILQQSFVCFVLRRPRSAGIFALLLFSLIFGLLPWLMGVGNAVRCMHDRHLPTLYGCLNR